MASKKDVKVKVIYKPMFGIRQIDPYEWNEANGYVQEVPLALASELFTYPDPNQFEIAAEDVEKVKAFILKDEGEKMKDESSE